MKISVRLTLYSVAVTAAAVVLCCAILLITTANNRIGDSNQNGVAELRMLDNAFNAEMDVVGDDALSDAARRSLILYVFRKYTDASVSGSHYVLTDTEKTIFNDSPIDPRPLLAGLAQTGGQAMESAVADDDAALWPSVIAELDGRKYLVAGHWSASLGDKMNFEHEIFLVRDITDVYDGITALGVRFALIALATAALSAAVMIFVVRRVMRPLGGLQKSAAALAGGQYGRRITVRGQDEIAALGESFNQMAEAVQSHIEALEDTAEQRRLLLSALTHELKTPMTAIIGYSEALMRVHLTKAQQDESVAYINSECKRIERLAQKMMQLVTLEGGEMSDIRPRPVKQLYDAVEMTLRSVAQEENIELSMTETGSPVFEMDIDMMASVLINLFDNARKAGARHITIAAGENTISVGDDGEGIPPDEIRKITQPFYMVDKSHSRSAGGSGLGLALCEMIVRAHRAEMKIQSRPGEGTIVSVAFLKFTV
jgi:two-component system phosphate regulon sensor histidine kinase PhoR